MWYLCADPARYSLTRSGEELDDLDGLDNDLYDLLDLWMVCPSCARVASSRGREGVLVPYFASTRRNWDPITTLSENVRAALVLLL